MKKTQPVFATALFLAALPAMAMNVVIDVHPSAPTVNPPVSQVTFEGLWKLDGAVQANVDQACDVLFWDAETGGRSLGSVSGLSFKTDSNGCFIVSATVPSGVTNDVFWVGVKPAGHEEIAPRMRVAPVPFALAAGRAALVTDASRLTLTGTASVETMNTTGDVAADSLTISSTGTLAGRNVPFDTIRVDSLDLRPGSGLRLFPDDLDTNANYDYAPGNGPSVYINNAYGGDEKAQAYTAKAAHDGFAIITVKSQVGKEANVPKLTVKAGGTTICNDLEIGSKATDTDSVNTTYRCLCLPVRAGDQVYVKVFARVEGDWSGYFTLYNYVYDGGLAAKVRFVYFGR